MHFKEDACKQTVEHPEATSFFAYGRLSVTNSDLVSTQMVYTTSVLRKWYYASVDVVTAAQLDALLRGMLLYKKPPNVAEYS